MKDRKIPGAEKLVSEHISKFYVQQAQKMVDRGVDEKEAYIGLLGAAVAIANMAVGPRQTATWLVGIADELRKVGTMHLN